MLSFVLEASSDLQFYIGRKDKNFTFVLISCFRTHFECYPRGDMLALAAKASEDSLRHFDMKVV